MFDALKRKLTDMLGAAVPVANTPGGPPRETAPEPLTGLVVSCPADVLRTQAQGRVMAQALVENRGDSPVGPGLSLVFHLHPEEGGETLKNHAKSPLSGVIAPGGTALANVLLRAPFAGRYVVEAVCLGASGEPVPGSVGRAVLVVV